MLRSDTLRITPEILLRPNEKGSRHRGQYKTHSNSVAAFGEDGAQIGIVFETASPFNTPRLMAELVTYVPYSSLESVTELNREAHYLALRQTQVSIRTDAPAWQPWLMFFLRSLAEQVRRTFAGSRRPAPIGWCVLRYDH